MTSTGGFGATAQLRRFIVAFEFAGFEGAAAGYQTLNGVKPSSRAHGANAFTARGRV